MKVEDRKSGKTILALILDGYMQYVNYGYPNDPQVYVIKASTATLGKLKNYIAATVPKEGREWQFQMIVDMSLKEGRVVFGPEQLEFIME